MSVSLLMPASASRPKVHRPPKRLVPKTHRHRLVDRVVNYGTTARLLFTLSSLSLALILGALFAHRFLPSQILSADLATTPQVVLTSDLPVQPEGKTIILKEEDGMIVGQMARIAPIQALTPEVKTMSAQVDKRRAQELLSIINQY